MPLPEFHYLLKESEIESSKLFVDPIVEGIFKKESSLSFVPDEEQEDEKESDIEESYEDFQFAEEKGPHFCSEKIDAPMQPIDDDFVVKIQEEF